MFLLRSGLRFSFQALEVPDPRVRKRTLSHTKRIVETEKKQFELEKKNKNIIEN